MDIKNKIRDLRKENGYTQEEVAYKLGMSTSAYGYYEQGKTVPPLNKLRKLASIYNISISELTGEKSLEKIPGIKIIKKFVNVPILGEIACGQPMFCEENFEGIFQIDEDLDKPDFCLIARGDSMIDAGIHDGDIVFMRKTSVVENGKIAAVYYDEDVTLKRYYRKGNQVILQPENKFYSPIIIDLYEDIPLQVLGELIGIYSKVSRWDLKKLL